MVFTLLFYQVKVDIYTLMDTGIIYLEKFGESKLGNAGECFLLAKQYERAAEVYARANLYAECLYACRAGMFFDTGFLYILQWRQHMATDVLKKLQEVCQDFLKGAALHCHEHKDTRAMMKFVKSFHSEDSMRVFLRNLSYFDELLLLEKEWGNFLEAANIAKLKGYVLFEADMLDKAGKFREASMIMLWYVFDNSVGSRKSKHGSLKQLGPRESKHGSLKQLTPKDLLGKAKSISLNHSNLFHEFVCREAKILSSGKTIDEVPMIGLRFIRCWKRDAPTDVDLKSRYEVENIEQHMLERCAHYYNELKDKASMMNYVRDFHSPALMRAFLGNLNCLDELFTLEKEWGNFLEAADIAKMKGWVLLEAEMLEKARRPREASMLMLWFIFENTVLGSKCCPLQLTQNEKLLEAATKIAKKHSDQFYKFVSREAEILSNGTAVDEFFAIGLKFIQCWKQDAPRDVHRVTTHYDIQKVEQHLLERCARYSYEVEDKASMMKYVREFHSIDLRRMFLKALNCIDELLVLEVEDGKGDLIHQADLLEEAGHFEEASKVILLYVLASSLWVSRSKGWPLRQFGEKEELLARAMSCVQNQSDLMREFVRVEVNILSNQESSLSELRQYLIASHKHKNLRGQILCVWKILDAHLNSDVARYEWSNELVSDKRKNAEDLISEDGISVETLIYFWNFWKKKILNLLENLGRIGHEDMSKSSSYWEFCLNYMGVRKLCGDQSDIYLLVNAEANWVKEIDGRSLERKGSMVGIGPMQLVCFAQSYWGSELFRVGVQVLETLRALQDYTVSSNFNIFHQTMLLSQTFEVADFLKEYKIHDSNAFVEEYITPTVQNFIRHLFPLDWRKSSTENMILLRGNKLSKIVMTKAIFQNITKTKLTYGQMGRVLMLILGFGKLSNESYMKIVRCFGCNSKWMSLVKELSGDTALEIAVGSEIRNTNAALSDISLFRKFYEALQDTYRADWKSELDYISPTCFLYIIERLLFIVSYSEGYFFTTKSIIVEWLISQEWTNNPTANLFGESSLDLVDIHDFIVNLVHDLLLNKTDTLEWIKSTENISEDYFPLLVVRLVILLSVLCVNSRTNFDKLFGLLYRSDIGSQLPRAFRDAICRRDCYFVDALADALKMIENPLVVVNGDELVNFSCSGAIFLNLKVEKSREDFLRELFPKEGKTMDSHANIKEKDSSYPHSNCSYGPFGEMLEVLDFENGKEISFMFENPKLKVQLNLFFVTWLS